MRKISILNIIIFSLLFTVASIHVGLCQVSSADTKPAKLKKQLKNPHLSVTGETKQMNLTSSEATNAGINSGMAGKYFVSNGQFTISFDGDPWLQGLYEKGVMIGDWTVWEFGNTNQFTKGDFAEMFHKAFPKFPKPPDVFPYYLDLEGNGHYEILIMAYGKILVLDPVTHEVIYASSKDNEVVSTDGRDVNFGKISKNGPYCFWFKEVHKSLPAGIDSLPNGSGYIFSYEWHFYVFIHRQWQQVFHKEFDGFDAYLPAISLDNANPNGLTELNCESVIAKWNPVKRRFVEVKSKPSKHK